eukprot:TRINITY_DN79563_c0_g1_i1.p1 TRINITY_DN79563_c0_g1~~TRINITY_DN79563_c0_g1_i1.p1  ORF type:complete len:150 (+),score=18.70 TRINITY_DN79563_c0_g1_i1:36-485(+)
MKTFVAVLLITIGACWCQKIRFQKKPVFGGNSGDTPAHPPPPPGFEGFESGLAGGNTPVASIQNTQQSSRPSSYKWVYCNGRWRQVTRSTCEAVFIDPTFADHSSHCSFSGSLYGEYDGTSMWLFDPSSPSTLFRYCAHMPSCFCRACN